MTFAVFRDAIAEQFAKMAKKSLYCASVDKDTMRGRYIASFPPGTNPMFRKRTEHECSCCFGFIKTVGNVVAITETGEIETIWDITCGDPTYDAVAKEMAALIRANPVRDIFLHYEENVGTKMNYEPGTDGGPVTTWNHFHVKLPVRRNTGKNIVVAKDKIGTLRGKARAAYDVFSGGLEKINVPAIDIALELIGSNSLYRGAENKAAIVGFRKLKVEYDALPEDQRDNFVWSRIETEHLANTQIKNTSIGELLLNLSENEDVEVAVGKYEAMVAPTNYRRPTALVTKAQVERARQTVEELGFTTALSRRYARLEDISVANVLYADRTAGKVMKGGDIFDTLTTKAAAPPKLDRVEEIPIDRFLAEVLPKATTVEVLFENRLARNLMSLIAPVDPAARNMFKWDNPFSWTYTGDATDSIKERVKKAGGNVTGELCCRLAWHNHDDLDFHMVEPGGEISFIHKISTRSGGRLDVDMNAGHGQTREPVENIFYEKIGRMPNGTYRLFVRQYMKRESVDVGFDIEIDHLGSIISMSYDRLVHGDVSVAEITKTADGLTIKPLLPASSISSVSQNVWGLQTGEYVRVNSIMLSPNYWDGHDGAAQASGAQHYFFMLDGAENDGTARGFYNEFLHPDLNQHRKVLEMVGAKMRTDEAKNQLSGVGFIATARNSVVVRVSGAMTRVVRVNF